MPELPPVIATFLANISDFKAKLGEAEEKLTSTATLSEAKMAEIEASVDAQVAEMATAAAAAGAEFDATATKAELMATKTEESSAATSGSFSKMGSIVKVAGIAAGLAVVAFAAEGVKAASTYSTSLASIQGNAQITATAAKSIGNAFLSTAGTSTASAQEMATAFAPVAGVVKSLNGGVLTAAASLGVMKAAVTESEASGTDLTTSTAALTGVMQAFQVGTAGAADTANILFNTSRVTGTGLSELSSTVEKLHAKLGVAGPNLADTSALMVDLAKNGIVGSRGVMAVQTGMTTLLRGSAATNAQLKALGVSVYDSAGKFVGMSSVMAQLQPKLAGMTDAQRTAAESVLFGASAASAMNLVVKGGVAGLTSATAAVTAKGAAEAAAAAKAHTLAGQGEILKSTVEDLSVKVGQLLIPYLVKFESILVTTAGWIKQHQGLVKGLALVIGTIALAWGAWTLAVKVGTIAQAAFDAVMDANPIMLVVVAIAALAVGIYEVYKHWTTIWGEIKHITSEATNFVIGIFNHVWSFLKQWGPLILSVLAPFIGLPLLIIQHWGVISSFFSKVWSDVETVFTTALSWLYDWFIGLPIKVVQWLVNLNVTLLQKGKDLITGLWNGAKAIWTDAIDWVGNLGKMVLGGIGNFAVTLYDAGTHLLKGLLSGMVDGLKDVVHWVESKLGNGIIDAVEGVFGINSPSRVMAIQVGLPLVQGIGKGMIDNASVAKVAAQQVATATVAGARTGLSVGVTPATRPSSGQGQGGTTIIVQGSVIDTKGLFKAAQASGLQYGTINSQTWQSFKRG